MGGYLLWDGKKKTQSIKHKLNNGQSKIEEVVVNNNGPQLNKFNEKIEYGIDMTMVAVIIVIVILIKHATNIIKRKFEKNIINKL